MEDLVEIKTFNLQKMCRSCLLESNEEMYDIFKFQMETMEIYLFQILQSITPLQIDNDDGMPKNICKTCCGKANSAYLFKLSLESSDSTLREYLFKDDFQDQDKVQLESTDYLLNMKREIAEIAFVDADPFDVDDVEEDPNSMDYNDQNDDQPNEESAGSSDDGEDYIPEEGVDPGEHIVSGTGQVEYVKEADGKYLCLLCNKKLCDKKGLNLHRRLHTGEKLKTCNICQRGFIKSDHLKRHLLIHERSINCEYCAESFTNKQDYKTHVREEHFDDHESKSEKPKKKSIKKPTSPPSKSSNLNAVCKICDKRFIHIASLRLHLIQHGLEDTFDDIDLRNKLYLFDPADMDVEKMQLSTDEELIVYIKAKINESDNERLYQIVTRSGQELMLSDTESEDDETDQDESVKKFYNCSKCVKIFKKSKDTMNHFNEDHQADLQDVPDKCATCNANFPNTVLLFKHLKSQCESKTKKFRCGVCNIKFMWIDSLAKHTEVDHPGLEKVKVHSCDLCGKSFGRAEHMERHRKTHNPGEKKFECTICKKKFNRKDNLRSHMKIHKDNREDEDKHLCIYCGRSFSNSSNLIVHMRRHTGEKPYRCDLCEKGFPRSSDLQCHRRTHTGEKPCLCTICGKGFSRSNKLVRHMRIHTGIRPYQCTYCDRAFTQSNDLTLHVRRHTGEKPYVCGVCGDRFIQGTALKQHQRMQGHFEGSQPSPYSAISVNNPSRFTNSNLVNRRYMEQQAAASGVPGTIKPVIPRRRAAVNPTSLQQNLLTSTSSSAVVANQEQSDGIILGASSPSHSASTTPQMALQMDDVKPNIQNINLPSTYNFMPHLLSNHLPNPEMASFLSMSFNQNFSNSN